MLPEQRMAVSGSVFGTADHDRDLDFWLSFRHLDREAQLYVALFPRPARKRGLSCFRG